ncbi:MAG: SusC/RagA family TonB-linked outer membrane protein [Chitinophagaceae bacterium]
MRKLLLMAAAFLFITGKLLAQKTVVGKVTDDQNNPIPNVSVIVKGTNAGTISKMDGTYSLTVPATGKVLIFSSVDMDPVELTIGAQSVLNAIMKTGDQTMSEIVITGSGVATSKKKLGISVETITADKLPIVSSLSQALIGKVAGAQISSTDGTPGARVNILLRGVNSLRGGTYPMILLDGIEVRATDLSAMDMSNVDRIEIVEGAASSTIYGAQGANGVIQIFSKKGKPGRMSINVSSSYGTSSYLNEGNLHKAKTHGFKTDANNNVVDANGVIIQVKPDGTYTAGVNINGVTQGGIVWNSTSPSNNGNKAYGQNFKYYDHLDQVLQSAQQHMTSLNINGGGDRVDYSFGISHNGQESNLKKNGELKRSSFSSNIGVEVFKNFKVRVGTQLIYSRDNFNPYFTAGPSQIFSMLNTSPFIDFEWKDANGDYAYVLPASPVSVNGRNPNYYYQYSFGSNKVIDVIQNVQANYKLNRFVELDFKYGINYQKQDVNQVYKNQSQNINALSRLSFIGGFSSNKGGISNTTYNTTFQNALSTATVRFDLQKDFNLKIPITTVSLVGYDYRKNVAKTYTTTGDGLQLYPIYNMTQTDTRTISTDRVTPFITFGTFFNQAIDYGNLGGIKGGFRSDFSSAFGNGSKAQTFYNGNAYFRLSQLKFWSEGRIGSIITEFKLRGGYGEAGIQPNAFDRYVTLSTAQVGSSLAFVTPSTQSNPDLIVEISKEKEIGADITAKLAKGNWFTGLTFSTTVWSRKSEDIIYTIDAPPSSGGGGLLTNAYSLSSKGYTFSLNLNVMKSKDMNWDFITNFNHQASKIDDVKGGADIVITSSAGYGNYVLRAGEKIGQLYGLKTFTSVDQLRQDGSRYIAKADVGKYQLVNGYVVDTSTKGLMFTNENYAFGDPNPKFNMSFINYISYKGFGLSFQLDWIYGSHLYNQTKEWMYRDGIHGDFGDEITVNGQTGAWSNYYISAYSDMWGSINGARNTVKDYFYEDASFLRLRNVSISYDAASLIKVKAIKKLEIVLTGRNLLTATKYTGFDPETNSGTSNSGFDRGVDYVTMPNSRSFMAGINLGF